MVNIPMRNQVQRRGCISKIPHIDPQASAEHCSCCFWSLNSPVNRPKLTHQCWWVNQSLVIVLHCLQTQLGIVSHWLTLNSFSTGLWMQKEGFFINRLFQSRVSWKWAHTVNTEDMESFICSDGNTQRHFSVDFCNILGLLPFMGQCRYISLSSPSFPTENPHKDAELPRQMI